MPENIDQEDYYEYSDAEDISEVEGELEAERSIRPPSTKEDHQRLQEGNEKESPKKMRFLDDDDDDDDEEDDAEDTIINTSSSKASPSPFKSQVIGEVTVPPLPAPTLPYLSKSPLPSMMKASSPTSRMSGGMAIGKSHPAGEVQQRSSVSSVSMTKATSPIATNGATSRMAIGTSIAGNSLKSPSFSLKASSPSPTTDRGGDLAMGGSNAESLSSSSPPSMATKATSPTPSEGRSGDMAIGGSDTEKLSSPLMATKATSPGRSSGMEVGKSTGEEKEADRDVCGVCGSFLRSSQSVCHGCVGLGLCDKKGVYVTLFDEPTASKALEWACTECTYLNPADTRKCQMCETKRPKLKGNGDGVSSSSSAAAAASPSSSSKKRDWTCPSCTLLNAAKRKSCKTCGVDRPYRKGEREKENRREKKRLKRVAQELEEMGVKLLYSEAELKALQEGATKDAEEEVDDDEERELTAKEKLAGSLFHDFVDSKNSMGKQACLVCYKNHSTKNLMIQHLVKYHLEGLFKGDFRMENEEGMRLLRMEADESLARRLALVEEGEGGAGDDVESGGGGGSSSAPARPKREMRKRKRRKDDYDDDSEDDSDEDDSDEKEEEEGDDSDDDVEDIHIRNDENGYPLAVETRTRRTGRCLNRGQTDCAAPPPPRLPRKQSSTQIETEEEMEARKRHRMDLLVKRTTGILEKLEKEISALVTTNRAALVAAEASTSAAAAAGGCAAAAAVAVAEASSSTYSSSASPAATAAVRDSGGGGAAATTAVNASATEEVLVEDSGQPKALQDVVLRDYQKLGLRWMVSLYNNGLNGILADEMGLGKTVQAISLLVELYETKGINGPHLIVVPLSVLNHWEEDLHRCAPHFQVHVYRGVKEERAEAFTSALEEWSVAATTARADQPQAPFICLTTYEMILKAEGVLRGGKRTFQWSYIVVDEAHRLKNHKGKLLGAMNKIYTKHRLLLTGTPFQNDLAEPYSLLSFIQPQLFKDAQTFKDFFNQPFETDANKELREINLTREEEDVIVGQLHSVLKPFLLRRTKQEVLASLPKKQEKTVICPLSALQQRLYHLLQETSKAANSSNAGLTARPLSINNLLMQLRKVCNHPFLVLKEAVEWDDLEPYLNPSCGKLIVLDRILHRLKALGRRCLIFSQMTSTLDYLESFLEEREHTYLRLDGATPAEERTALLKQFNGPESDTFLFLISTKAGGVGLNLQSADTVIIYDSDWNPQNDLQAQSRVHRIGQTNEVLVLRFVSVGLEEGGQSVEGRIQEVAGHKLKHEARVIAAGNFSLKKINGQKGKEEEENVKDGAGTTCTNEMDQRATLSALLDDNGGGKMGDSMEGIGDGNGDEAEAGDSLFSTERMNFIVARDERELVMLRALTTQAGGSGWEEVELMGEEHIPDWFAKLEGDMLGLNEQDEIEPGTKRRRCVRYDSLSDSDIYQAALARSKEEAEKEAAVEARREAKKKEASSGTRRPSRLKDERDYDDDEGGGKSSSLAAAGGGGGGVKGEEGGGGGEAGGAGGHTTKLMKQKEQEENDDAGREVIEGICVTCTMAGRTGYQQAMKAIGSPIVECIQCLSTYHTMCLASEERVCQWCLGE